MCPACHPLEGGDVARCTRKHVHGPPPSGAGVDLVLRRLEASGEQQLRGVGGLGDEEGELPALRGREVLEDEVGGVLPAGRAADADAHPEVVLRPGGAGDGPQPVVAALAPAALEADSGERQVELVVHHDEVSGRDGVVVEQAADGATGLVHVGHGPGQHDAAAGQPAFADQRPCPLALPRGELDPGAVGQLVEHHGADVVAVAGISRPRVAQADDQEGSLGHARAGGAGGAGPPAGRALGQRVPQLFSVDSIDSPLPWACGSGTASPWPTPSAASADSSRSIPASASASDSSASSASAVGAPRKPMTRASGSVISVAPAGSTRSPAVMFSPAARPVTSTSMLSGSRVASASIETVFSWWLGIESGAGSPMTTIGTSTVVFSPRRTSSRSTCSWVRLSGSRWTALVRASCSLPSRTIVSRALAPPLRRAAANSRAGRDRWTTSWPCPYRTAGTRPARRVRRALPLPNSVRVSASRRKSATVVCSSGGGTGLRAGARARHTTRGKDPPETCTSITESGGPSPSPGNTKEDTWSGGAGARRAPRGRTGKHPSEAVRRSGGPEGPPRTDENGSAPQGHGTWPRWEPGGRQCYEAPSKRLVTEPSSKTSLMARARSGAIDRTVSLSNWRSGSIGSVLVTMTSLTRLFLSRSTAGPERTPCVAVTMTSAAPASKRVSAAFTIVPPVSIMSSTRMQTRPSTSPTTRLATTSLGRMGSRVLWMNASGVPPSLSVHRSATRTRPESGETTVMSRSPHRSQTWPTSRSSANRWSTGPSKKPWIWAVCRSTVMSRSAPAVLNMSATRRAEIGSRPRCFLSCRA